MSKWFEVKEDFIKEIFDSYLKGDQAYYNRVIQVKSNEKGGVFYFINKYISNEKLLDCCYGNENDVTDPDEKETIYLKRLEFMTCNSILEIKAPWNNDIIYNIIRLGPGSEIKIFPMAKGMGLISLIGPFCKHFEIDSKPNSKEPLYTIRTLDIKDSVELFKKYKNSFSQV